MNISKEDLTELREVFRKRMDEADFCIGQEQVEKLFRELLEEPEPEQPYHDSSWPTISAADVLAAMESVIIEKVIKSMFERDDTFYKELNKKR